ncbi:NAD-dependent epimerase/dehydratase family protein [Agathobacter rectalis]|jgi:nucleoside-diphosphate-sugar epimerase|uniref:NAD-dependent epimerase/dehydratase family protein n=1 Tax=Agathobacter rectalis TaxID=39491 RepID=A0A3E4Y4C9_9FIRM|nr:NAD-dependent epimerase/dehydratase family protein [Agathobacter rectalis]RGM68192.1 NAD-dependent epimerase/dehydratase family protein [Agathobacter rectalis]
MRILILGGTGAMGTYLVQILKQKNCELYVTSRTFHESKEINYILGDAKNDVFLKSILNIKYDAIIDFMVYSTEEFRCRYKLLLEATKQYFYFSSARVYANSDLLTEDSQRLLDSSIHSQYIQSDEYAIAKAKQEDILRNSDFKNWTIVRPYITYSDSRLQLGFFEKELWLYRAIKGKTIIFPSDINEKITTLTYGGDVANAIVELIGKNIAMGNTYQIMQNRAIKWGDVLKIYMSVLGDNLKVTYVNDSNALGKVTNRKEQIKYDRLYDRKFDNSKICSIDPLMIDAKKPEDGLKECLLRFINNGAKFDKIDWKFEGYADKITKEKTRLKEIKGVKSLLKYLIARYTSYFERKF